MTKIIVLILGIFIINGYFTICYAADPWTKKQKAMQATAIILYVADWGQTLDIVDKPDQYYETNPILGEHPSRGDVNTYFASLICTHFLITYALPSKWRKHWLGGTVAISAGYVKNNYSLGLRINF